MIKREAEKETPEDLKQAFRVFDKVGVFTPSINNIDCVFRMATVSSQLLKSNTF